MLGPAELFVIAKACKWRVAGAGVVAAHPPLSLPVNTMGLTLLLRLRGPIIGHLFHVLCSRCGVWGAGG